MYPDEDVPGGCEACEVNMYIGIGALALIIIIIVLLVILL
jgi:hypothetical protein